MQLLAFLQTSLLCVHVRAVFQDNLYAPDKQWRGKDGKVDGTWLEKAERERIKRIQLRHALQGSLNMSKQMKMTSKTDCCGSAGNLAQAGTQTTY